MIKALPHYRIVLGITMILGVGLTILATAFVSRWEISKGQLRFQGQIENLNTSLQRSLNRYTDLLAFLGDYYTVKRSLVERQEFAEFVKRSLQTYPGIQALEWAPLLPATDRLAYEQTIRSQGYPNFQITELGVDGSLVRAAPRPYYIPVTYVEPFLGNESAFGYDLNSDLTRAIAIAQARDSGEIRATRRIRLVQEKRDQFGFLVFQPTYAEEPLPTTIESRREKFSGVLIGVFRIADVVEESLQGLKYEIDFTIEEQNTSSDEEFLEGSATQKNVTAFVSQPPSNRARYTLCAFPHSCTRTLTVGQQQWLIVFYPSPQYPVEIQYGAIATLMAGLGLTTGLVLFLEQLSLKLQRTESLNYLRLRFFSMVSHELRTPLSTILLSSEFLQTNYEQFSEDQKLRNIRRIYLTARQMSQQVGDLLMLTRAEAGKLEFNPELLDLENFCQQLAEDLQIGISQPIQFTGTGGTIKAFLDKKLLRSLLTNLLTNAAKYSPEDAPIELTLDSNSTKAIIQVKDQGIGILTTEQRKIAEAFYRGSNVGEAVGTGLGLAIVKTCVELHKGTWQIDSQADQGTVVTVELPLE